MIDAQPIRIGVVVKLFLTFLGLFLAAFCLPADAQLKLAVDLQQKIDQVAVDELAKTQEPRASIAVVKGGQIAYLHAYGSARLDPSTPARPEMRYSIGSISKQFTVTAILLLQEQGNLSIDDKVGKFVPGLTQGNKVTIRQLLSHTSGYQDFYAPDYLLPIMLQPTTALKTVDLWARKPLDFEPGTKWQYSNTQMKLQAWTYELPDGKLEQYLIAAQN
jgi:D-alanyl-D-alanine carboxypeptidase